MDAAAVSPQVLGLPFVSESIGSGSVISSNRALHGRCGEADEAGPAGGDEAPSRATLHYRRSERTALYIETQEGDVVRLRIKLRDSASATWSTSDGETPVAQVSVGARSSVSIRFSVEGDLSAEELAAIRSVVEQAGALATEFFSGDAPAAFASAAAIEIDGAQLARVGLRLSVREQLGYAASATYRPAPPPVAASVGGATALATAPAPADNAAAEPAPAGVSVPPPVADAHAAPAPSSLPETAATATAAPGNVATRTLATIAEFLANLLDSLAAPPTAEHDSAASVTLSLKLKVLQSVVLTLAATEPVALGAPSEGLPLLGDTLDALSARASPVDTRA